MFGNGRSFYPEKNGNLFLSEPNRFIRISNSNFYRDVLFTINYYIVIFRNSVFKFFHNQKFAAKIRYQKSFVKRFR